MKKLRTWIFLSLSLLGTIFLLGDTKSHAIQQEFSTNLQSTHHQHAMGDRGLSPSGNAFRERTPERKRRFNEILDILYDIYAPIVESKGKTFKIVRFEWPFNSLNIRMDRGSPQGEDGDTWRVIPTAGIFLHKLMNEDAFTLLTCHEIGHHLGGVPNKRDIRRGNFFWSTTEGQSDYFASAKCFRQFAERDGGNLKFLNITNYPELTPSILKKCRASFSTKLDVAICLRNIRAGIVTARFMAHYNDMPTDSVDVSTPDPTQIDRTGDHHPDPQCRLDTFVNGALCDKKAEIPIGEQNLAGGACARSEGYTVGVRPRCWFNPESRYLPYNPEEEK